MAEQTGAEWRMVEGWQVADDEAATPDKLRGTLVTTLTKLYLARMRIRALEEELARWMRGPRDGIDA